MKFLLDTHVFLWYCMGDNRLSDSIHDAVDNTSNHPLLSIVSVWEMAIKSSLGKIHFHKSLEEIIPEMLITNGINMLSMEIEHIFQLIQLPFHHRDPFDRMLIAQAVSEKIPLASADKALNSYPVDLLWD